MFLKLFVISVLFLAMNKEVAYVDLTTQTKSPDLQPQTVSVRGSGILYHGKPPHPLPGTPPISLKLNRIVSTTKDPAIKEAIEVLAVNTGDIPIAVPIGTDTVQLLKSASLDRRYFDFTVTLEKHTKLGFAESASNGDHPETVVTLQPGEGATFLIPMARYGDKVNGEISVSLQTFRKVIDKGTDWTERVGEEIYSNSLSIPH